METKVIHQLANLLIVLKAINQKTPERGQEWNPALKNRGAKVLPK
jgi:hypothetical protein